MRSPLDQKGSTSAAQVSGVHESKLECDEEEVTEKEFMAEWARAEVTFADLDRRMGRGILVAQIVVWVLALTSAGLLAWAVCAVAG